MERPHGSIPQVQSTRQGFWTPLRLALIALLIPALWFALPRLFPADAKIDPEAVRLALHDAALESVLSDGMARDNGAVYAVDVCQLATYAALAGDRELYDPLRDIILNQLLVTRVPGDPAHGMIAWRYRSAQSMTAKGIRFDENELLTHDASGTTEALRAAEALWQGVQTFGLDEDRESIRLIIDAYARHAATENGTWMIRNYFNLHPEVYNFITNSFLVDYDPDLLSELVDAGMSGEEDWAQVTEKSAELIDKARTPAGLLHQMIRPEVGTIMPQLAADGIYSANGIEQLNNVLTVAERCVTTNPDVSRGVLAFCRDRLHQLRLYYHAQTGKRVKEREDDWAGVETWGPLLRLAVKLDDPDVHDKALRRVAFLSSGFADYRGEDRMYLLGEALLSLEVSRRYVAERPASP